MIERINARRTALADQLADATRQYDQLEATLKALDRQICAMHGAVQELDALLQAAAADRALEEETTHGDVPEL